MISDSNAKMKLKSNAKTVGNTPTALFKVMSRKNASKTPTASMVSIPVDYIIDGIEIGGNHNKNIGSDGKIEVAAKKKVLEKKPGRQKKVGTPTAPKTSAQSPSPPKKQRTPKKVSMHEKTIKTPVKTPVKTPEPLKSIPIGKKGIRNKQGRKINESKNDHSAMRVKKITLPKVVKGVTATDIGREVCHIFLLVKSLS